MESYNIGIKLMANVMQEGITRYLVGEPFFYYGPIHEGMLSPFSQAIENLAEDKDKKDVLLLILDTPGGSAEAVERMVKIMRLHFTEVYFIVPNMAMSAGTIFCMSGDKIFMDKYASLGPIDPQVWNGKSWVPASGHLKKIAELIKKSNNGTISKAEIMILVQQDLAMISQYENAKTLTNVLIKEWLVKYKFKDWTEHRTNPSVKGQKVTHQQKIDRADEIATKLGDESIWLSHGRLIDIDTLNDLKLKIDDLSDESNLPLRKAIREYFSFMQGFIANNSITNMIHTRLYL